MRITIDKTPEQVALIKALGSKKSSEAMPAMESFAAFIANIVQVVLQQAPTVSNMYKDLPYDEFSQPSIPLDLYYDVREKNLIKVWSQTVPGGLPTQMTHGIDELMVATYPLVSALAFLKDYARQGRLDVVSKALERMAGEFLLKQETNAASVMLNALAAASSPRGDGTDTYHIIRTATQGSVILDDFNRLLTLAARVNSSWVGGTPVGAARRVTDLVGSPEFVEKIRAMAYEPINTQNTSVGAIPATDKVRDAIYDNAGVPSFYGINIMQINELGKGMPFNTLFDTFASSTTYDGYGTGSAAAFDGAAEELVIGIDNSRDALVRPVLTDSENGGTLQVFPDDQWAARSEKVGYHAKLREGRVILDDRALFGLIF